MAATGKVIKDASSNNASTPVYVGSDGIIRDSTGGSSNDKYIFAYSSGSGTETKTMTWTQLNQNGGFSISNGNIYIPSGISKIEIELIAGAESYTFGNPSGSLQYNGSNIATVPFQNFGPGQNEKLWLGIVHICYSIASTGTRYISFYGGGREGSYASAITSSFIFIKAL